MSQPGAHHPYGSMEDLPSVIEARQMLLGMKLFGWLGGPDFRKKARELRAQLDEMTGIVDRFYDLLGERGWIFHDDLPLAEMSQVVVAPDPEEAEERLIDYYMSEGRLQTPLRRLGHHAAMRPRMLLVERALQDYQERRYYSCVLVLLAITDGFVNDFEPAKRRGLHARDSEEMSAWDKAAGHHQGLAAVHRVYSQRVSKLDTSEQFQLRRNGLVHGMLPNFDNAILATKAWNLLFAVADWADGEVSRTSQKDDEPSLREALNRYRDLQELKSKSDRFEAYEVSNSNPHITELREFTAVSKFLDAWNHERWGLVGAFFMRFGDQKLHVGRQAEQARSLYEPHPLSEWSVDRVCRKTSSLAFVDVELVIAGSRRIGRIRLVLCDDSNRVQLDPEMGEWFVAPHFPSSFWENRRSDNN